MISAEKALENLRDGNQRFVAGTTDPVSLASGAHDAELCHGQHPFAVVLACSDSRVPVEIVFDQGFGNLFVIRVAGNLAAPTPIGSVEYAVEQFDTPLVVVMGHSHCGAVIATLRELAGEPANRSPGLRAIVDRVRPAIEPILAAEGNCEDPEVIEKAVRANIMSSVRRLSFGSRNLERRIDAGEVRVIGAIYSIETGHVEFLEEPTGAE